MRSVVCFFRNETGQGILEYSLVLALVAFVVEIGLTAANGRMVAALSEASRGRTFLS